MYLADGPIQVNHDRPSSLSALILKTPIIQGPKISRQTLSMLYTHTNTHTHTLYRGNTWGTQGNLTFQDLCESHSMVSGKQHCGRHTQWTCSAGPPFKQNLHPTWTGISRGMTKIAWNVPCQRPLNSNLPENSWSKWIWDLQWVVLYQNTMLMPGHPHHQPTSMGRKLSTRDIHLHIPLK